MPIAIFCPVKSFLLLCNIDVLVFAVIVFDLTNLQAIAITSIFFQLISGEAQRQGGRQPPLSVPLSNQMQT